ncbi:glycine betaine/proline transport system ATP-binding protein [Peptoniphilus ivorii]|uniref:quaternary amine ABC transporter ATP-binding protein n=1 Tax=Aedoeadaptatus ivorii TaxID=54006 RepID=UPI002789A1CA|nr:glycine betaine/L-proline ABC transporter ATP-binding protein [Peptoniphilus ivorii]MDQ0508724.1 glycine betaine/proline transport system ATP-binding protein [Peptoniphilus ivorii]
MQKIVVEQLTKIFGKDPKKGLEMLKDGKHKDEILEEIGATVGVNRASFTVEEGEVFVIMGLSGSGKSTLIRLVNRMIEPTAGKVYIDGEELTAMDKETLRLARREKMSMVFQSFALFPHKTVLENAAYGLTIKGVGREEANRRAEEALLKVGLDGYTDQYPDQLSGGMQQRVGLARALAADTNILIMDEAFSALDPLIRKEMQDELLILQSEMQKTVLFITHDLNEALKLGDRIALMKDGEIVQIGTPDELLNSPANNFVEEFVRDVDRSKILDAASVMIRPDTINISKNGPRSALMKMRSTGNSSVYVVNNLRELQGVVTADDALAAVREGNENLESILIRDIPTASADTQLDTLIDEIYDSKLPIAIVEGKRLKGIVIRGTVLAALAGKEMHDA